MATAHGDFTAENRETLPKQQRLIRDMREVHEWAHGNGRRLKTRATLCWYVSAVCACVASFSGFFAMVPQVEHVLKITPWMVSAAAALGSVIQIVQRNASWGVQSKAFYRHRDAVGGLIARIDYETQASDDRAIAGLSREFRQERERLGQDLHRIDNTVGVSAGEKAA